MKKLFLFKFIFVMIFCCSVCVLAQEPGTNKITVSKNTSAKPSPTVKGGNNINININVAPPSSSNMTLGEYIAYIFKTYKNQIFMSLGWTAGIFIIGIYGLFFPVLYYLIHLHPSIAIRISYAIGIFCSYIAFHVICISSLTGYWLDYRLWITWFMVILCISLVIILMPKNRKAF